MIELTILNYLRENGIDCYMSVPSDVSGSFCVLEKTGSSESEQVPAATIAIQSYGLTLYDSMKLNAAVKRLMKDADTLPEIVTCALNSDYNFPDVERRLNRCQAVFYIVFYED